MIPLGSTNITLSKYSLLRIKDELASKKTLKDQKGMSQCSVILCPRLNLFEIGTMEERVLNYNVKDGPLASGRVIQVPNQRKICMSMWLNITAYTTILADG